jgi:hypothetical protein
VSANCVDVEAVAAHGRDVDGFGSNRVLRHGEIGYLQAAFCVSLSETDCLVRMLCYCFGFLFVSKLAGYFQSTRTASGRVWKFTSGWMDSFWSLRLLISRTVGAGQRFAHGLHSILKDVTSPLLLHASITKYRHSKMSNSYRDASNNFRLS